MSASSAPQINSLSNSSPLREASFGSLAPISPQNTPPHPLDTWRFLPYISLFVRYLSFSAMYLPLRKATTRSAVPSQSDNAIAVQPRYMAEMGQYLPRAPVETEPRNAPAVLIVNFHQLSPPARRAVAARRPFICH